MFFHKAIPDLPDLDELPPTCSHMLTSAILVLTILLLPLIGDLPSLFPNQDLQKARVQIFLILICVESIENGKFNLRSTIL